MIKTDGVIRIDVPTDLMTAAQVEALILAHRGLGVQAANPDRERKESQADLKIFLTYVTANGIPADEAGFQLVRTEERPDMLRLSTKHNDYLFFALDTHEDQDDDGKVYEYIKSITLWEPGEEAIRPEEHLLIAPPMYMDELQMTDFLMGHGFSATDYSALGTTIKGMIDDYPIQHGADRPRMFASRLYNARRVDAPHTNDFKDRSGVLYLEVMVADKSSWSRAGQFRITTGWKAEKTSAWSETIIKLERPENDEPEMHAMAAQAGVYRYVSTVHKHDFTIFTEKDLHAVMRNHMSTDGSRQLSEYYLILTSSSNPNAVPGPIGYRLRRICSPNLVDGPNPCGMLRMDLFTGKTHVGSLDLRTKWVKPMMALEIQKGSSVTIDWIETVDSVILNAETQAKIGNPATGGWGGQSRWGGGHPQGWQAQAGLFGSRPPSFAQHHAWGPAMQTPFGEEAKLSTFSLDSYDRILTALVDNIPLAQPIVRDVVARMSVVRGQTNQQSHGQLMYQFEFIMTQGLLMRVMSQSGVVHLQQVVPMSFMASEHKARW